MAPSAFDAASRVARLRLQSDHLAAEADAASLTSIRLRAAVAIHDRTSHQSTRIERSVDRADGARQSARNAARIAAEAEATYRETYGHDAPDVEPEPEPTLLPPVRSSQPVRCLWCDLLKPPEDFPAYSPVCRACWRASNPKHDTDSTLSERDPPT